MEKGRTIREVFDSLPRWRRLWLQVGYARHWLRFKCSQTMRPYVSNWACSSWTEWGLTFHRFGFVLFTPGKPNIRCGRRIHVSWRFMIEGPCDFWTWALPSINRLALND